MIKFILVFFLISSLNVFAQSSSQLPKCTDPSPTRFNDCTAEITLKNGNKYKGKILNRNLNLYKNIGNWKDDK